MADEEVFRIQLGELPETVKEAIRQETKHYNVPLVVNEKLLGSGALVEIYGHFGVLTAEHVAHHPFSPERRLTDQTHNGPKLLIPPMDSPGDIVFDSYALRVLRTKRQTDEYGPDLALVVLPPSEALNQLRATRSFYPIASAIDAKLTEALQETGFVAFCGFPASTQSKGAAALGFSEVIELGGFAFMTGPEKYEERDDWDYFELGVRREQMGDVGDSFGGVSGGGVWRVPVYRKSGESKGSEYFEDMTFAGVAFYEENHLKDGRFFVRTHGPRSIYNTFLHMIRAEL